MIGTVFHASFSLDPNMTMFDLYRSILLSQVAYISSSRLNSMGAGTVTFKCQQKRIAIKKMFKKLV